MEYNESNINVTLKGTKTEIEKAKGWFKKLFSGDKEWEEENLTQGAYLKKIYDVCSELGYTNILSLTINDEIVYEDSENTDNDFEKAIKLAFEKQESKDYTIAISLDTTNDEEENILITMESKHDSSDYPLKIQVSNMENFEQKLEELGNKIKEHFETEEVEIEADEESESDDDEDDSEDEESEDTE